jgi:two-component sensor histidine kinase
MVMNTAFLAGARPDSQADFRQLRHQTKNALARIIAQVSSTLSTNDSARRVAKDVERRIVLTAQISDALFGLTRAPGRFEDRLCMLCEGVVDLSAESDQHLTLRCTAAGQVPLELQDVVLRVAHELVGNAVKHGMHVRLLGRIEVRVETQPDGIRLDVADDGWGCGRDPSEGEGLKLAGLLAGERGGRVTLERVGDRTVATLCLPVRRGA